MRQGKTRDDSQDDEFDLGAARDLAGLVWRAPLRRPKVALVAFVLLAGTGLWAAQRATPMYQSEAVIAVQKSAVVPSFGEQGRGLVGNSDFDPSLGVSEAVKKRENLVALLRQTHLVEKTQFPPTTGVLTSDDKLQILVRLLEPRLTIRSDGVTVTFSAEWTDPDSAYDLVSSAVQSFLDGRSAAEVSIIGDAIALLEEHARGERDGIDTAMEEFIHLKEGWKTTALAAAPSGGAPTVYRARPASDFSALGPDNAMAKRLEEIKLQVKETEDERRRQLSELKAQLAGLLGTYTPSYPPVIALQRKIDALAEEPANLVSLKNQERGLLNQISSVGANAAAEARSVRSAPLAIAGAAQGAITAMGKAQASPNSRQDLEIADPESAMALSKLQNRIHKYEEYMDQISAAKLELDLARNAFRYRYGMYRPAERPTHPKRPIRLIIGALGVIMALLWAVGTAALLDLFSGRFVESWQVKRRLDLPIVGEVPRL